MNCKNSIRILHSDNELISTACSPKSAGEYSADVCHKPENINETGRLKKIIHHRPSSSGRPVNKFAHPPPGWPMGSRLGGGATGLQPSRRRTKSGGKNSRSTAIRFQTPEQQANHSAHEIRLTQIADGRLRPGTDPRLKPFRHQPVTQTVGSPKHKHLTLALAAD